MSTRTLDHLPPTMAEALRRELDEGEVVQWSAQPGRSGRMKFFAGLLVPFGLIFAVAGAAFVWITLSGFSGPAGPSPMGIGSGPPTAFSVVFALMGGVFAAIGVGVMLAPVWVPVLARRLVYAVTDRRVITIWMRLRGGVHARSMRPGRQLQISRVDGADGVGDIVLSTGPLGMDYAAGEGMLFMGVRDARDVERLIRLLFQDASTAR